MEKGESEGEAEAGRAGDKWLLPCERWSQQRWRREDTWEEWRKAGGGTRGEPHTLTGASESQGS